MTVKTVSCTVIGVLGRWCEVCYNVVMSIVIDPKQSKALQAYKDPTSPTFANLKQSMIQAGYDDNYADTIYDRKPAWLTENIQADIDLIKASENNLRKYATMQIDIDGKNGIDLAKLQVDVSKFIAKTLARKKYSEDKEDTTPAVTINIVNYGEKKDTVEPIDVEVK